MLRPTLLLCLTLTTAVPADELTDRYRQPDRVMAALAVRPGQRVADLGAGSGYFTVRLADAVGDKGHVVATDLDERALTALRERAAGRANVEVRQVAADDPGLEPGGYDLVLLSELDQYLQPDRATYLARLRPSLARRGRVAVVNRAPFRTALLAAARSAGFRVVREAKDIPDFFLVILEPGRPRK